jgi:hypothetical protein
VFNYLKRCGFQDYNQIKETYVDITSAGCLALTLHNGPDETGAVLMDTIPDGLDSHSQQ